MTLRSRALVAAFAILIPLLGWIWIAQDATPATDSPIDGAPVPGPFMPRITDPELVGFGERVSAWGAALDRGEPMDPYELFNHLQYCAIIPERLATHERQCVTPQACDARALHNAREWSKECAAVGAERIAKRFEYLALAASRGDVRAQSQFTRFPLPGMDDADWRQANPDRVQDWERRARRYLQAAADRGALNAIAALASHYQEGRYMPADPVLAYAHYLAYLELRPELGEKDLRTYYGRGLDEAQVRQARELAAGIVRRCCR